MVLRSGQSRRCRGFQHPGTATSLRTLKLRFCMAARSNVPLAVPELGPCASPGRTFVTLGGATLPGAEASPLDAQPLPWALE